jgi:DMSO/TMAO reductase YedYZ molybdopterin-dependent catalytic subunit
MPLDFLAVCTERFQNLKMLQKQDGEKQLRTVASRRQWISGLIAASALAQGQAPLSIPGKRSMLVHNDRPEDLETPLSGFDTWLTPNDIFFVRQHLPRPSINEAEYRVAVDGKVNTRLQLSLAELRKLPQYTVPATLECTGNARGFFRPRVPGIQWGRGAIGNAEWSGPRLSDVLKLAGAALDSAYVTFNGADAGVAKTPDFIRSLPMRKVLHPATLLGLKMNGEAIPELHGFPVRLIVPGWDGTSWVKWVTTISVADEPNTGFFMNPAYRFPKHPGPPGASVDPADLAVIEGMPVKSFITSPSDQDTIRADEAVIKGIAWAGEERVTSVAVSTDGGSRWEEAELSPQNLPFAWRLWTYKWKPIEPGYYTLLSRSADSAGRVQPIVAIWNPSGYLYSAVDRIGVKVEKI